MNVGYIRVSTQEQNTARQDAALSFCDTIFEEHISGKNANRPELQRMLSSLREGDTVWITELSRLGRSMSDLCDIVEQLQKKGVALKSLKENIDLSSATGVFTYHIFAAVAEFERAMIKERQAEGIAQAKASGKSWGAKAQYEISDDVFLAYYNHERTLKETLDLLGISQTAFYSRYRKWKESK